MPSLGSWGFRDLRNGGKGLKLYITGSDGLDIAMNCMLLTCYRLRAPEKKGTRIDGVLCLGSR